MIGYWHEREQDADDDEDATDGVEDENDDISPAKSTCEPNEDGEEEKDDEDYHRNVRHRPWLNFRLFRLPTVHLVWKQRMKFSSSIKVARKKQTWKKAQKSMKISGQNKTLFSISRKKVPAGSL